MPGWMHPTVRESHKMYDYIKKVDDIIWIATLAPNISDKDDLTGNYKVIYNRCLLRTQKFRTLERKSC